MNHIDPNLSMQDYLDHPAYGSSDLRTFRAGPPAMVPWRRRHREDSAATIIGSAAHMKILTPHDFDKHYWVKPEGMEFRSKENKDLRDSIVAQGLTILSQADMAAIGQIADSFFSKEALAACLRDATQIEGSVFWTCRHSGLPRKCRPDWWDHEACYDLKISRHATKDLRSLFFSAQAQGWLEQGANARAGLAANGIQVRCARLVVIAPNPPQALRLWMLEVSGDDLDIFELQNEHAAVGVKKCEDARYWPGTPDTWIPFEVMGVINEMTEDELEGAEEAGDDNPLI